MQIHLHRHIDRQRDKQNKFIFEWHSWPTTIQYNTKACVSETRFNAKNKTKKQQQQ